MVKLPEMGESDIKKWVGDTAFQRGYRYFENESILNPRRRGSSLISECQGSQFTPYRVEINLGSEGILRGTCTCPAGDGGYCKHAAALLLTWLHEPEAFTEVPEIEQALENRSKDELIALIQQMVLRHSDLEQMLELSVLNTFPPDEALPAEMITQQIRRAYTMAGGVQGDNAQIANNLQPILDLAEDLLDRDDIHNAATVYIAMIENLLAYEESLYQDEGGDLGQVMAECEEGIQECLHGTQDAELRQEMLRTLFSLYVWDLQAGGLGFAGETPSILAGETTAVEKQMIAAWIQDELPEGEAWDEDYQRRALGGLWLSLLADQLDDETFLRICRQTGRTLNLIDRLLSLGRVDEALVTARSMRGYNITAAADLFEEHGYPEMSVQLIQAQPNSESDVQLLEWMKQYAIRNKQPEEALRLAESLFWHAQSLENYNALLEAAAVLEQREIIRQRVLDRLENAGNFFLLVEIYLLENEQDLALAALERVNPDIWWGRMSVLRHQVAQAFELPRPREAIRQYMILAEDLINQRSRGSYAEAARLLQMVKKLHHGLGEEDRWEKTINSIRQEYRYLPALLDELRRAEI